MAGLTDKIAAAAPPGQGYPAATTEYCAHDMNERHQA